MRHLKAGKRLGVTTSHRKAMMRNLVTALLDHGEITTTITRAKEMRKYFDKMITLGKKGTLHSRRQALSFVKSKGAVAKLFDEYATLYAERSGGYTRIYRLGNRLGDNARMALIQMVGVKDSETTETASDDSIKEIKEELQASAEVVDEAAEMSASESDDSDTSEGEKTAKEEISEKKAED